MTSVTNLRVICLHMQGKGGCEVIKDSSVLVCALARFTILQCEHKTTQMKQATTYHVII